MEASLIKHSTETIPPAGENLVILFSVKVDTLPESFEFKVDGFADGILLLGLGAYQFEYEVEMKVDLELFLFFVVLT
jgi:hypothetical protein